MWNIFFKIVFCKNTFKQNRYYISLTNQFPGLARGPIDHEASSVINVVADDVIDMGSAVILNPTIPSTELLPRVNESGTPDIADVIYGVAVGGDTDGIYGDGSGGNGAPNQATSAAGEGVVVVTQGRCLARVTAVDTDILIGGKLTASGAVSGVLTNAVLTGSIIATALQPVVTGETDMIAVDIQREGVVE